MMRRMIEDYPSVNEQFNDQFKPIFMELIDKVQQLNINPENQINSIVAEQFRRIKTRSNKTKINIDNKIQALSMKKAIKNLKKDLVLLKQSQPLINNHMRSRSYEPSLQYTTLQKQLQMQTKIYLQQKQRRQIQKKQMQYIVNALQELDNRQQSYDEQSNNKKSSKNNQIKLSKKIKFLQNKKRQLFQIKQKTKNQYENMLKQKISKLITVQETGIETKLLEIKMNRDLDLQKQFLNKMRQSTRQTQTENDIIKLKTKKKRVKQFRRNISDIQTQPLIMTLSPQKQFTQKLSADHLVPKTNRYQTISIQSTPSHFKEHSNIILHRKNYRSPINLTPSKFKVKYTQNNKTLSSSHNISASRSYSVPKKTPVNLKRTSQIKLNESANFDVSMSSSMYQKTKGIQLIKQSIVELSTIHQQKVRKRQLSKPSIMSRKQYVKQNRNKQSRSKAQMSQTTKQQYINKSSYQNTKGIPFECNKQSQQQKQQHNQNNILSRYEIKVPSFRAQQF